ncbi:unnamed protein product, partial [Rotaria sp. Silwood1]
ATSSSSNGMDFQDIHHQASNTCKKKRYFKHIRCQGSPVCLILSLLGLVLLGAGIAAMLVALIGIFTTTITATTTSATTTTGKATFAFLFAYVHKYSYNWIHKRSSSDRSEIYL